MSNIMLLVGIAIFVFMIARKLSNRHGTAAHKPNDDATPDRYKQKPATQETYDATFDQFRNLFAIHFPEYKVEYNVPASRFDRFAHPACTPIQFLFSRNDRPVLAVVLVFTRNYRGTNVAATQQICANLGIDYIRFFVEYRNEDDYVVNRVREHLENA